MFKIRDASSKIGHAAEVRGMCPHCHQTTLFEKVAISDKSEQTNNTQDKSNANYKLFGVRRCPGCKNAVFFVSELEFKSGVKAEKLLALFPAAQPQFDKEGVPEMVSKFLTEALICFREGCFTASAIMIRRTLEEICSEAGAEGASLHARILDLPNKTAIHQRYIEAMMDLKYLGNDAVHIELKSFDQIGKDEVDLGLELIQTIIQSWFKFMHIQGKLQNLKKA